MARGASIQDKNRVTYMGHSAFSLAAAKMNEKNTKHFDQGSARSQCSYVTQIKFRILTWRGDKLVCGNEVRIVLPMS